MPRRSVVLACILALTVPGAFADEPCVEHFELWSAPGNTWLGLHPAGANYGVGQTFTLNCGAQLESVTFKLNWGNDVGEVRSLGVGDVIHAAVLTLDGEELGRCDWTVDASLASRRVDISFADMGLLLPVGTYLAACWTDAPACGGVVYATSDMTAGHRYTSTAAADPVAWFLATGDAVHTIALDSDVTPAETWPWSSLKTLYR